MSQCTSAMPPNSDPEGKRLPIKLDSTSNGEFVPIPRDATNRRANQLARRSASENARRRGIDRRAFMVSACGAASTLLAFNAANAASGRTGGFFELEQVAAVDPGVALDRLGGREFVFDVQGHFVGQHGLGQTGLDDAREIIKAWRIDYNTARPHSALDYATPEEFASSLQGHAPGEMTTSARPGQNQQPGLSC